MNPNPLFKKADRFGFAPPGSAIGGKHPKYCIFLKLYVRSSGFEKAKVARSVENDVVEKFDTYDFAGVF